MRRAGFKHSPETIVKMQKASAGRKVPQSTIDKSVAVRKGKALSVEHRANISKVMSEYKKTPEHIANVAASQVGRKRNKLTEEQRLAISKRMIGVKRSAECRENISKAVKLQWKLGKKLPVITRGRRTEYCGIIFRSTWEARVAKALDLQGVEWEYEKHRIDLGSCTYIPDFYIPTTKMYIEVKGWMDDRSKLKLGLFRDRFPEANLLVATLPVIEQLEQGVIYGGSGMEGRLGLAT